MKLEAILAAMGLMVTGRFQEPHHQWIVLNDRHWEITTDKELEEPDNSFPNCGPNMVEVKGNLPLDPDSNIWSSNTIDQLQKKACVKWLSRKEPLDRCAVYDRNIWLDLSKNLK